MSNTAANPDALAGKVAVVTGAARGVGAELAAALVARGAKVALLGLEPEELERTTKRIGGGSASWIVDVTDAAGLEKVAAEVLEHFGRVDIVVANAGIASGGSLAIADPRAYERTIEVNLFGSVRTIRAFLPAVTESRGYILQIASLAAMLPTPLMSAYGASKSGVEAFAHALRGELRHKGVDVGVGYLTWTDTEMVRGADRIPGLAEGRKALPWPFNQTAPLAPAVERIADGIVRRSPHVYAQAWVRLVQPFRPLFFHLGRFVRDQVSDAEAKIMAAGPAALGLTGAGGAADSDASGTVSYDRAATP